VSDNIRFCATHQPITTSEPKPTHPPPKKTPSLCQCVHLYQNSLQVILYLQSWSNLMSIFLHLSHQLLRTTLLHKIYLPSTANTPSQLSPKQIQDMALKITKYLQKHGHVTPELLHMIHSQHETTNKSTPSTPSGHPILLSSNKMSNTAASHTRLTVQQVSRYLGFCSLKNWDILYNVCQPTFSPTQSSDSQLELGTVANIKKACQNKTPVPRPFHFLEVVHCDIGYGDCKTVGNGALYYIILVDPCYEIYVGLSPSQPSSRLYSFIPQTMVS
jgi:hypothetical protein